MKKKKKVKDYECVIYMRVGTAEQLENKSCIYNMKKKS